MPVARRKPRAYKRFLQTLLLLGLSSQAMAQEVLFVECRVTTAWAQDAGADGNWGPNLIIKIDRSGMVRWRSETRAWTSMGCEPVHYVGGGLAYTPICTSGLTDGEAWLERVINRPSGRVVRSRLHISRTTGIYKYESVADRSERTWFEQGICSPTENPETAQTQRVF